MNKKNNSAKRSFVPQIFGDTLKKINRRFSSKFNKLDFIIRSKWPEIVGSYFKSYSEPINISSVADYENEYGETIYKNHLNVSVAPAAAIEFQHFKDKILEKINSYFGYKAIIDLRIQQNYIPKDEYLNKNKSKIMPISPQESELISNEIESLQNNKLKDSLMKLGKNIVKEVK